jgi:hypothetical protein
LSSNPPSIDGGLFIWYPSNARSTSSRSAFFAGIAPLGFQKLHGEMEHLRAA